MSTRPANATSFGTDRSLSLLRHGYRFWEVMRRQTGSEIVRTRFLHERVTGVVGADAARFFYEETDTERGSALPMTLVGPLFGKGAVHTLDGGAHAHRKDMFNRVLGPTASLQVTTELARRWDDERPGWKGSVDVFQEVGQMLLRSGCAWVGITLHDDEVRGRARDMQAMVDGFGGPNARQLRARRARRRSNAWAEGLIMESRRSTGEASTVLDVVAHHRDRDGDLLPPRTAAVELLNLIRPLVAASWLVSGMFEAFDVFPDRREDMLAHRVSGLDVAQEVRRTYPFAPFLATRATRDLVWQDAHIPSGTLIALDLWGTNHDPRVWREPDVFDPRRFQHTPVTPYNLVPQGGGFREGGHRCPGEDMTLAVLATLAPRVAELRYDVVGPRADLRRMPPQPRCRVEVRR